MESVRIISIAAGLAAVVMVISSPFLGTFAFIFGAVLAIASIVAGVLSRREYGTGSSSITLGIIALMAVVFLGLISTVAVDAGEKGVVVNSPSGNIGEIIDEGWHFDPRFAFASIDYIRFNTQTVEYIGYDGDIDTLYQRFIDAGFLGGVKLADGILFAVTETRTKEEIDNLVKIAAL